MAARRLAPLLALTLLAPLALGASGSLDQQDPQGDETSAFSHPLLPPGLCSAPAADVLSLRVRVEGDQLVASLRVRDVTGAMTCGSTSFGPAIRTDSGVDLAGDRNAGVAYVSFRVSTEALARVNACWTVHLASGAHNLTCATLPWSSVFQGSEWTLQLPLAGTATSAGGPVAYDLRGQDYTVHGRAHAYHGALVFGRSVTPIGTFDGTDPAGVSL